MNSGPLVWTLVPARYGKTIIGSKWVFRNKRDETRIVIKNKARLVAQGYNQQEYMNFIVYQMDVKSAFLNGILKEVHSSNGWQKYMNFIVYQMDVKSAFLNGKLYCLSNRCQKCIPSMDNLSCAKIPSKSKDHTLWHSLREFFRVHGIDYDETFALVAILEAIKIFLDFATYMNSLLFLMMSNVISQMGKSKDR
ncbi:retrovirus-related pol polyprotein from transposon TNT 1-94 [Tanacetum coccineum]